MDIAYISGIEQSHRLQKLFANSKQLLMKCKFNDKMSKFEPLEIDLDAKHPTPISDINLDMLEESEEED